MDIIFIGIIIIFSLFFMWLMTFVALLLVFIFTPGGIWLKAKILRRPLICARYKDGIKTQFIVPKKILGNFAEVRKVGCIELAKDTANFDTKGKVIWYDALLESAKTHNLTKAALLQELKEFGYKIDSWRELREIIDLSKDKNYLLKKYEEVKKKFPEKVGKFKKIAKNLYEGSIEIIWGKTYKIATLYNLFANDYNPAQVNEYGYLAVQEDRKKRNVNVFIWVILIAILLIVAAIAYTIIKSNAPTQVVLEVTPGLLKNSSNVLVG